MAAPRSIELNDPDIFRIDDHLIEVRVIQDDNLITRGATAAARAGRTSATGGFALQPLVDDGLSFLHHETDDGLGISAAIVILRGILLVGSEELDGGEA